jgi:hypothetical protein
MQGTGPVRGSAQRRSKTESEGQFVAASFIVIERSICYTKWTRPRTRKRPLRKRLQGL